MNEIDKIKLFFLNQFIKSDLEEIVKDIENIKLKGRLFVPNDNQKVKTFKIGKLIIGCTCLNNEELYVNDDLPSTEFSIL